jgi:hypothetical protein
MAEVTGLPGYVPGKKEIPLPLETMLGDDWAASLRENNVKKE